MQHARVVSAAEHDSRRGSLAGKGERRQRGIDAALDRRRERREEAFQLGAGEPQYLGLISHFNSSMFVGDHLFIRLD
jgi:hypothetical protein